MSRTLLYLHIPKTAGGSISRYLYRHKAFMERTDVPWTAMNGLYNYGIYHYPRGFFKDPAGYESPGLSAVRDAPPLHAVLGHYSYGIHRLLETAYRYITVVRDPVARIGSLYSHLRVEGYLADIGIERFVSECPEDAWLRPLTTSYVDPHPPADPRVRRSSMAMVDNDQARRISGLEPPFGQADGVLLESAKQALIRDFEVIGTTERFDETLLLISKLLGSTELPTYVPIHQNRKRRRGTEMTQRERDAVLARNGLDAELHRFADRLLSDAVLAHGADFIDELEAMRDANVAFHADVADRIEEQSIG